MDVHAFLRALGRTLREARERAGRTVTEAAHDAGVSRRHWTETEAGRANPSVLVLARQAQAAGIPLSELVSAPLTLHSERIALVGLRGAGKTTVGRLLARELEVPFVELDRRVEELAGLGMAELFELEAEDSFRRFEAEALERYLGEGLRSVVATGGSIVLREDTFGRLQATCHTVWLRASAEEHFERVLAQGDRRPMRDRPRARDELTALLKEREPLYARCAQTVDTSGRVAEDVAQEILAFCHERDAAG